VKRNPKGQTQVMSDGGGEEEEEEEGRRGRRGRGRRRRIYSQVMGDIHIDTYIHIHDKQAPLSKSWSSDRGTFCTSRPSTDKIVSPDEKVLI
jgi:hypothetical protein